MVSEEFVKADIYVTSSMRYLRNDYGNCPQDLQRQTRIMIIWDRDRGIRQVTRNCEILNNNTKTCTSANGKRLYASNLNVEKRCHCEDINVTTLMQQIQTSVGKVTGQVT